MDKPLASYIDHTILKPDAAESKVRELCEEAKKYHFASVCVNLTNVPLCAELLADSGVMVCCVVGFPLGAVTPEVKAYETKRAVELGAQEVDMVINICDAKNGDFGKIEDEIREIKAACGDKILKVIIETCYLTEDEKIAMCRAVTNAKADYIKTSTGFGTAGATIEDIILFRENIGPDVKMKAAGGMKTYEDMLAFLAEGADRLGTSSGVKLVLEHEAK